MKKSKFHDNEIADMIRDINITDDYYTRFAREYLYQFLKLQPNLQNVLSDQFLIDNDL